jgi:hypothetical protein
MNQIEDLALTFIEWDVTAPSSEKFTMSIRSIFNLFTHISCNRVFFFCNGSSDYLLKMPVNKRKRKQFYSSNSYLNSEKFRSLSEG